MASNADVIKEFLVSLGWKIDQGGMRKFATSIALQTAAAEELSGALAEVARKALDFTKNIAEGMEKLYFASMRTKASVANIQALDFAAGQMGSTADAAQASLENLARFMRTNPGSQGLIQSLGVQTQEANGDLRDTADIMQDLGKRLAQMPYYRANAYGQLFGIDEKTLMTLRAGLGDFGEEYKDLLQTVGLDSQSAAKASHDFMNQLRGVRATIEVLAMKVASAALPALMNFTLKLRQNLIQNLPWISAVLTQVIKGIISIIGMVGQLGGRALAIVGDIIGWWDRLDQSSKMLVEAIGGIVIAWRLLNSAFLISPIGIITALGAAILLLYDDYKTWKEGGKSLIDWAAWEPDIEKAKAAIKDLIALLKQLYEASHIAGVAHNLAKHDYRNAWRAFMGRGPAVPRGIRNNNPGNLNFTNQEGATREAGPNGRFAVFQTAEAGLAALAAQLRRYAQWGIDTVAKIIAKYAPPGENNTNAYVKTVSKALGVDPNAKLDLSDPKLMTGLMDSIIKVENSRNPYSTEQLAAAAQNPAGAAASGVGVTIHQTNTTTVTGAGDPHRTAQLVGDAQSSANQMLIRNTKALAY